MDKRIIKFFKDKTNSHNVDHSNANIIYKGKGKEYAGYISIEKVDISKSWFIYTYDGAESIYYIETVDKDLNFYETKWSKIKSL
jgi:YHS domain-containing protein